MLIALDPITKRKLVLVKLLYRQAERLSINPSSMVNGILAVIGFDLTVETLAKVIVSVLDQKRQPQDRFVDLLNQCDTLLQNRTPPLPTLPYRANVEHVHSIRNDAQHKAKYPNTLEVSDCRTWVGFVCRDVTKNIWDISFDSLSQTDLISDQNLQQLLNSSLVEIDKQDFRKAISLAASAFFWSSRAVTQSLPYGVDELNPPQLDTLESGEVDYLSGAIKSAEKSAMRFAALLSSGINFVEYEKYRESIPVLHFWGEVQSLFGPVGRKIDIHWKDQVADRDAALWVHDFVVNAIVNWENMGLQPQILDDDQIEAQRLLAWGEDVIVSE